MTITFRRAGAWARHNNTLQCPRTNNRRLSVTQHRETNKKSRESLWALIACLIKDTKTFWGRATLTISIDQLPKTWRDSRSSALTPRWSSHRHVWGERGEEERSPKRHFDVFRYPITLMTVLSRRCVETPVSQSASRSRSETAQRNAALIRVIVKAAPLYPKSLIR